VSDVQDNSPAPALDRGLAVLELVCRAGRGIGFGELASRLALPTASAARLVRVLVGRGYLAKDTEGNYVAGPAVGALSAIESAAEALARAAAPRLAALRDGCANTAIGFHWNGRTLACIGKAMHPESIVMQEVGTVRTDLLGYPWSAFVYRDLLGHDPHGLLLCLAPTYEQVRRFDKLLARCAEQGYAVVDEPHIRRLTAPLMAGTRLVGALAIGATPASLPDGRVASCGALLATHAHALST